MESLRDKPAINSYKIHVVGGGGRSVCTLSLGEPGPFYQLAFP